ncbi:MAG: hypothetical protein RLZZ488_895 [Pseudomonadota bacterium]|jgi:hypothetical protein
MSLVRSEELSRLGLQFGVLAAAFAQSPSAIRAVHIRRAERALVALEEFSRGPLPEEARQWLNAKDAYKVLQKRLETFEKLKAGIDARQSEIADLTKTLSLWNSLPEAERQKFIQNHNRAQQFCDQKLQVAESHILHKYSRYKALNKLLPYADNAEHLCDAIFHYQNRVRYEENIQKIEQRRENATERLASVRRGFNLALFMCVLIVSLPLCVPVAFSLWNRKREIEHQLANMLESQKREERRLQIADEGVIASEEIKEILGEVPLETIRRTLEELRELRSEFQRVDKNPSTTAALVAFIDLYKPRLRELFGEVPEDMAGAFRWFKDEVDRVLNVEAERSRLMAGVAEMNSEVSKLLKGHAEPILRDSFVRVKGIFELNFSFELDEFYKVELARQMSRLPALLQTARLMLSQVSHGQIIDHSVWQDLYRWMLLLESNFQAMALELQLSEGSVHSEETQKLDLELA